MSDEEMADVGLPKIESGIRMPGRISAVWRNTLARMRVGQSFALDRTDKRRAEKQYQAIMRAAANLKITVASRRTGNKMRIWRTK